MTIQEMKERKKELGYTNEQISELSGVPLGTVQKIFGGATTAPRYETLQALQRILGYSSVILEADVQYYKKQGEYTLDDYYALPDEKRVELIDGVFYDMPSPTSIHQLIDGFIHTKLLEHVAKNKGECLPIIAPIDVQLDCDDKTMVQPDIVILCDRNKVIRRGVYGVPDLALEILSKSTRKKDMVIKLNKYMAAGVKEYWMVDPEQKRVFVYNFAEENYPTIYGFDAKVPVGIWNGECKIDFQEVYEYVSFLYEKDGAEI